MEKPTHFDNLSNTSLGQTLRAFLHEPEHVRALQSASNHGRAAVEGVAIPLEERFAEEIAEDKWRRLIGYMVRKIMEAHGYHLASLGNRVKLGSVFKKGASYRFAGEPMLEKLRVDLARARQVVKDGGGRASVETDLAVMGDLAFSIEITYPQIKERVQTILDTHQRLAPDLRVRVLNAA